MLLLDIKFQILCPFKYFVLFQYGIIFLIEIIQILFEIIQSFSVFFSVCYILVLCH